MKPRERVLTALRRGQPDRVPFFYRDVPETRNRLLRDLGCADDEELLRRLDIDFRWVQPAYVGPTLDDPATGIRRDIWGVEYRYVSFSGSDGYWEPVAHPMTGWTDPDRLDEWPWPDLAWMADTARQHGAHYCQHSCGAVRALIPDFIDIGVEVLDPVQVTAAGMVPAELKTEFGDRLCFSGGVDEMHLLREGTADDVRRAVVELLDAMAPGGGFFLGPTHNFQVDIPTENIVAMYEAGS